MFETDAAAERREQILGDVAEGLRAVFKEAQRRTLEAEDNDEFGRLSGTLCKLARGVRQCTLLHAKLQRERLADEADSAQSEQLTRVADVQDRRAAITRKVTRRFNEVWPDDDDLDENEVFNERLERLDARLDDLCEAEGFLDLHPDVVIARLCEEFGLTPPAPPAPLVPAKAGIQAEPILCTTGPQAPRANGHDPAPPDSS